MRLKIKKFFIKSLAFGLVFFLPLIAKAQVETKLFNPLGVESFEELAAKVLKFALGLLGTIALIIFIYGGFTWMTSGGVPAKVKKGRDTIMWAFMGIVVIFLSYALVATIFDLIIASTK